MNVDRYGLLVVAVLSLGGWTSIAGAAEPQGGTEVAAPMSVAESQRDARLVERKFRDRLATLHRLREIAVQHNAADRLAEIDELHEALRSGYADRMSRIIGRMHAPAARRLEAVLAGGRDRVEWVHRHRGNARTLWQEHRDHAEPRVQPDRDHREVRAAARERARRQWSEARSNAAAKDAAVSHRMNAASRLAAARWRDEARNRDIERWNRAARRSGMLDDLPASWSVPLPSQPELDARKSARISPKNADAEFRQLRREITGD